MATYAYCRTSTVEQAAEDRSSLSDQEKKCRAIATIAGLDDPEIFTDAGVSGSVALDKRPQGAIMLATVRSGDTIIAAKLDRLFRSAADALTTADALKKSGVALILADMGSDPVTDGGPAKLFFGMLALVAEFEKTRILERMADGRRGKKSRGGHIGGKAPYGFRKIGSGRDATLEHEPSEQEVIAEARGLAILGHSAKTICKMLNANGVTSRSGKPLIPIQISRMLKTEAPGS